MLIKNIINNFLSLKFIPLALLFLIKVKNENILLKVYMKIHFLTRLLVNILVKLNF